MANAQRGKCGNFGNCTKADTGEMIDIVTTGVQESLCSECGLSLQLDNKGGSKIGLIILGITTLITTAGAAMYYYNPDIPVADCKTDKQGCDPVLKKAEQVQVQMPTICSPLLMEGKKSLYQRVLIKPNSHKSTTLGGAANQDITTFSRYYIYERKFINGVEWFNIGSNTRCEQGEQKGKDGWIEATNTIAWKQQLSLTFTNTATKDRGRAYFFKDKEGVIKDSSTIQEHNPNIVAVEPENYVDPNKNFYLTPILDFSTQDDINLLKIATATLKPNTSSPADAKSQDLAIVFVVDTTISMKPYIEQVKEAVRKVYERFHNSPFRGHVKFGLVAFRSNIKAAPKLEYVTKLFVNPTNRQEEQDFINIVNNINEASVSSIKFDEDSYAGVLAAINQIDWENFLGRNIVLITDAGAIESTEKLPDGSQISSAENLDSKTIKEIAQKTKDINIYALHLKTPKGINDHKKAESQYKELSRNSITNSSLYYDREIQEGQTDFFGDSLDCIVQRSTASMLSLLENSQGQEKQLNNELCPKNTLENGNPDYAKQKDKMRSDQLLLGNALRLKYLGVEQGTQVPDIIEGWINDRSTETSPMKVQVNVLLSHAELNTLGEKIKAIIDSDADSKSNTSSQAEQFFKTLKIKASTIVQDPKRLNDSATVGELLNLEELQDLPYKSQIMGITEQDWVAKGSSGRETLLSTLRGKLKAYEKMEGESSAWHKLADESDTTDAVALIPLDLLP